jgi:hypothetical protein
MTTATLDSIPFGDNEQELGDNGEPVRISFDSLYDVMREAFLKSTATDQNVQSSPR